MALPKKKIDVYQGKSQQERVEELLALTNEKSTFLPKSILLDDLDWGMYEYFKEGKGSIKLNNKEVPTFFLVQERWADFEKTWQYADDKGNIKMPFITIRRSEAPKYGTNPSIKYRVAQGKKFDYLKVPTFENGVKGVDIYKIPQPTPVDIVYDVRIFTHFMLDINSFSEMMLKNFNSRQDYVTVKGHYVPMVLDNVNDESNMEDFEGQRFYTQSYNILMMGFLQDQNDFEVTKGVRRTVIGLTENPDTQID